MAATILYHPRRYRRGHYLRRGGGAHALPVVIAVAVLAAGASAKAIPAVQRHHAPASPRLAAPGPGEAGFFTAVLADLGAPAAAANLGSLAAWASHEGPWGSVGQWNPLDTILPEPGSWAFNSFAGGLHVQSYPSAATGAQATAATISGYPEITASLRSGAGLCGTSLAGEFLTWSGGGYGKVC